MADAKWVLTQRNVDHLDNLSIEQIFDLVKDLETHFGHPWLGECGLKKFAMKTVIFGPNRARAFVQLLYYPKRGKLLIQLMDMGDFSAGSIRGFEGQDSDQIKEDHAKECDRIQGDLMGYQSVHGLALIDDLQAAFIGFREKGYLDFHPTFTADTSLFFFDSDARIGNRKSFTLFDSSDNPIYYVNLFKGLCPSYVITTIQGQELLSVKKSIGISLSCELQKANVTFAKTHKKPMTVTYHVHSVRVTEGELSIRYSGDTNNEGTHYVVRLNDTIIATIADTRGLHFIDYNRYPEIHHIIYTNRTDLLHYITAMMCVGMEQTQKSYRSAQHTSDD